jgi:hypothetical protein
MARAGKAVGDHMAAWGQRKEFAAATEGAEELRQAAMREGEAFGKGTTQSRCTDAAFQRREDCREFMCFGRTRVFLESCLDTSEEEASLCAGAPSSDDLVGSIYWRVGRCEQRGTTSPACTDLMGTIQEYCASARVRL